MTAGQCAEQVQIMCAFLKEQGFWLKSFLSSGKL
jgi:hypothetical protein